jgi:PilZ domain-containing protein
MVERPKEPLRGARFSVSLAVECYPSAGSGEPELSIPSKPQSFEGEIKNISSRGACLITTQPLKVNEVLKVSFPIHSSISSFISSPRTLVEVKWTKPSDKDKFITGLLFLL